MHALPKTSRCPGCGATLDVMEGPVHAYMTASPACFDLFNKVLAIEYSAPQFAAAHRMTVDTYAVQHPGTEKNRRQIQSVGLHLARLHVQLTTPLPPQKTNEVMLGFSRHKASLIFLEPPSRFSMCIADVAPFAGSPDHSTKIRDWAAATWSDWADHHTYIEDWVNSHTSDRLARQR